MSDTIPVGKYYNFNNKNVDVVYNPAKDENESGSGGGTVFVDCTRSETDNTILTATKTAGEIINLIMDGNAVVFREHHGQGDLVVLMPCLGAINGNGYGFYVCIRKKISMFSADTASDYPYVRETK